MITHGNRILGLGVKGMDVDLQVLENEASKEYNEIMTEEWNVKYQIVPPDMHQQNYVERAIRTFKAPFLAILTGIAANFPSHF
jgi:hypothetical protein